MAKAKAGSGFLLLRAHMTIFETHRWTVAA